MQGNKEIIPAIIAKSQEELDESLSKVIDYVHTIQLDIMDDDFVPNTSLYFDICLPNKDVIYEAHLMVSDPLKWIEIHGEKVDTILVHHESKYDPESLIPYVKDLGKRVGLVLNPETPISEIEPYLDNIDQVLIMTVKPGFYGSSFLPEMLEKISELRKLRPNLDIEVDGGITDKTIKRVYAAGANMFVSGSYILKSTNIEESIKTLEKIVQYTVEVN